MRRHNFSQFNTRCYEEHLSPFGREVLNTLIKKWSKDRERNRNENVMPQQVEDSRPRNKVLTFSDNEVRRPPLSLTWDAVTAAAPPVVTSVPQTPPAPIHTSPPAPAPAPPQTCSLENDERASLGNDVIEDTPFHFPREHETGSRRDAPALAPTSAELVKTVRYHQLEIPNTSSTYNLVQTVPATGNARHFNPGYTHKFTDDNQKDLFIFRPNLATDNYDDGVIEVNFGTREESESLLKTRNVGWDDMFDNEILSEVDCTEKTKDIQYETATKEKIFEINFPRSKPKKIHNKPKKAVEPNRNKNKSSTGETRNVKRKIHSKVTDTIPKKKKKPAIQFSKQLKENKFNTQKYTETVNDWLNDVDPQHTVEEEIIDSAKTIESPSKTISKELVISKTETMMTSKDENTISNERSVKKVVQAQLANKDGVMKFAKPKKVKSKIDESVNGPKDKNENIKDKKIKSKFVAPIKSQIPVKDISYEIITVDEENVEKHRRNIVDYENREIYMIAVYSNGFCQLNQQHTEDTCAAEGILTCITDRFYYFKFNTFKDFMPHLLNKNTIISFDGKTLFLVLLSQNIDVSAAEIIDAKIGGALLAPDHAPENFAELQKLLKVAPQFTVATERALQKAAWYTALLRDCVCTLKALLLEDSLWEVFVDIEMKLLPIIADMEQRGVLVDMALLERMRAAITARLAAAQAACHRAAGRRFQVTSAPQVRALLYDELQLDSQRNLKIRETVAKGAKSTSEAMLKSLMAAHALPRLILEYRHLHKAHATFLTGIAQHVKDGVVKPSWEQTAAATGRIASNNPNLQAIPKAPFNLILFPGPEDEELQQQLHFRSVYVARGGHALLAADFQHVECRVFAHAAADAALLDALRARQDLFRVLAAKWLSKPEAEVSPADRERTKRIVYASLYGAGARKLMDILDVSYEQALSVAASFNKTFPALKGFGRAVVARCARAGGRLATLAGRARRFPNIASADPALRAHAQRQAVNFVVQGSAADLCKLAMSATAAALRAAGVSAHLLLQIHDELVWEVRDEQLHTAAGAVRAAMEACGARCGLALPLPVALSVGRRWGDMRDYTAH